VPSAGNFRQYGEIVAELAVWRDRLDAARAMQAAVFVTDEEAFADAEQKLDASRAARRADVHPAQLADEFYEFLASDQTGEVFPFPWDKLNELAAGGMRRGGVTVVAGHSSHGKSVLGDVFGVGDRRRRPRPPLHQRNGPPRTDGPHVARATGVNHGHMMNPTIQLGAPETTRRSRGRSTAGCRSGSRTRTGGGRSSSPATRGATGGT
jgi:hypothetical protein